MNEHCAPRPLLWFVFGLTALVVTSTVAIEVFSKTTERFLMAQVLETNTDGKFIKFKIRTQEGEQWVAEVVPTSKCPEVDYKTLRAVVEKSIQRPLGEPQAYTTGVSAFCRRID